MCTTLTRYFGNAVGTISTKPNVLTWARDVVDIPLAVNKIPLLGPRLFFWKHVVVFFWNNQPCPNYQLDVVYTAEPHDAVISPECAMHGPFHLTERLRKYINFLYSRSVKYSFVLFL